MPSTAAEDRVPPVIPVVAALIRHPERPEKILISRRRKGAHLEGLWEFPGGKQEPGEARFHALRRELEEELGIRHLVARPFMRLRHDYPEKRIQLDVWEVRSFTGEPEGREGQEWRWVAVSDLPEYDFPPADDPVLRALSLPQAILVTPDEDAGRARTFTDRLDRALQRGRCGAVLLRAHALPDDRYAELALRCRVVCERHGAELIVHRPTLEGLSAARLSPFRARHLSAAGLSVLEHSPFDEGIRLSASAHDVFEVRKAEQLGCRFAFLSPLRPTASHPGRTALGWAGLKAVTEATRLPLYALGGVGYKDFALAREQGAIGVAGISGFWAD